MDVPACLFCRMKICLVLSVFLLNPLICVSFIHFSAICVLVCVCVCIPAFIQLV